MGIIDRLKHWEARADAWAATRLAPDEFREAVALDRTLKSNLRKLALGYLGATVLVAALLVGIKPVIPAWEAFVIANVLVISVAIGLMGVWFGYRRHAGKPLWMLALTVIALTAAGALFGAFIGKLTTGKVLEIAPAEFLRLASIGVLTGIVVAIFVVGATWIRSREARAREATLLAETERERFAKRTAEAELKLLQAQVEPHFLFNTLANLRYLVQTGSPQALAMLDHLIDYLRTALPEMRAERSTVVREAALARAYLEILRIRMGGELAFGIAIAPGLEAHSLPPLMVMTLVENAVKHGIAPIGRGRIDIAFSQAGGRVRVEVCDDGRGVAAMPGQGVGLANIRERLAVLYGDSARLELVSREAGGARAVLEIPEAA